MSVLNLDEKETVKPHFWFGRWINSAELEEQAHALPEIIQTGLISAFPYEAFFDACDQLAQALRTDSPLFATLSAAAATHTDLHEAQQMVRDMPDVLSRKSLQQKMLSELGCRRPGVLERRYPDRQFEAWYPIGLVTHVMPSNVFLVAALGLVESLLAGNINIVKLSARDSSFAGVFAEALCAADTSGRLQHFVAVVRVSSSQKALLKTFFDQSDAVSAWGGEQAISAVRDMVPDGTRLIAWGHKISFNYFAADVFEQETLYRQAIEGTAFDVCRLDQQACSSPQTLWVEGDRACLEQVAEDLAAALRHVAPKVPGKTPDLAEQAEISTVVSIAQAEAGFGVSTVQMSDVGESPWRLLLDERPGLTPSPLYRTLWIRPIVRHEIVRVLRPMRAWLQSCGLACGLGSLPEITRCLLSSGVTRIARPGEMINSYQGSPHDGVYALQQMTRRVTVDAPEVAAGVGSFAELEQAPTPPQQLDIAIADKTVFRALADTFDQPDLVFRSGGSSGAPVWSKFTWDDYHEQMRHAAHGLVAAGLEPDKDRVMNLFAAGQLYGSFISFWSILETLKVPQLPMAIGDYYDEIVDVINRFNVNCLVVAPSYAITLFEHASSRLKHGPIKKIFYGGEFLTASQMAFLKNECGVETVRSAAYGSNDIGPMGYQCPACVGTEHHLIAAAKELEIVELESDEAVQGQTVGRLVFTPKDRSEPRIQRYEIGDTGRWVDTPCACGRRDPKFELVGRTGDFFKAGGPFLNYREFVRLLEVHFDYIGPVQIQLLSEHQKTRLKLCLVEGQNLDDQAVRKMFLCEYSDLKSMMDIGLGTAFEVALMPRSELDTVRASGKVRPVCDYRKGD